MTEDPFKVPKTFFYLQLMMMLLLCTIFSIYIFASYRFLSNQTKKRTFTHYSILAIQAKAILTSQSEGDLFRSFINQRKKENPAILHALALDEHGKIVLHSDKKEEGKFLLQDSPILHKKDNAFSVSTQSLSSEKDDLGYLINLPVVFPDNTSGYMSLVLSKKIVDTQIAAETFPFMVKMISATIFGFLLLIIIFLSIAFFLHKKLIRQKELYIRQKNTYLSMLAGSLAHEIKNPLNSLTINAQLLESALKNAPEEEKGKKILMRMKNEIEGLEEYLTTFLSYAKPSALNLKKIVFQDTIKNTLQTIEPECQERKISLAITLPEKPLFVSGDDILLSRAILNILLNAIQAINTNGSISVELTNNHQVCSLTIKDSGPGIPQDIRKNIFDLFVSTKTNGTGLGLAICKKILEEHAGSVSFITKEQEGTTFTITLPLAAKK